MNSDGESRELAGQVALITGAAGAIGRAIGDGFAAAGASLALVDVDEVRLARVQQELAAKYPAHSLLAVKADVQDSGQVTAAFNKTLEKFGRLDILVNNAAVTQIKPVEELSDDDINLIIDTNLKGYLYCAREAVKAMKALNAKGSLLFISSKNGLVGAPEKCLYCATKGAELTLVRALAMELGKFGIRVNALCPDAVLGGSGLWEDESYRLGTAKRYGITEAEIPEYYRKRSALKVNMEPQDVANAALFLVSSKAAKITGAILTVDGGVAFVR